MMQSRASGTIVVVLGQALAVSAAMLALAFAAPARGRILLIPYTPEAARRLPVLALEHGGRLMDRGPLPGSLIVDGDRAALDLLLRGVISLSGSGGCAGGVSA